MSTSANTVKFRVFDKDGKIVKEYSQNVMCKSVHKKELAALEPIDDYTIQAYGYDEDEAPWEGEVKALRYFMIRERLIKGLNYKEAQELAEQKNRKLKTGHDLSKTIVVRHFDGSVLEFHHSSWEKLDVEWYVVHTEHHGFHVYHCEDIKSIEEVTRTVVYRSAY